MGVVCSVDVVCILCKHHAESYIFGVLYDFLDLGTEICNLFSKIQCKSKFILRLGYQRA